MAKIVGLPKLSPTMEEGTLARWVKKEGDEIAVDDLVAEIETDKATMEWRAFDRAVLLKILVPEGATLKPDEPVAIFGERGEDISALLAQLGNAPTTAAYSAGPAPARAAAVPAAAGTVGVAMPAMRFGAVDRNEDRVGASGSADASRSPRASGNVRAEGGPANGGRILASPLVRRLAREHGLDLGRVRGSGPGGRIIKRDLDEALVSGAAVRRATLPTLPGVRPPPVAQKLSPMRKTIARRLSESKQIVPHFYLTMDVDADPLWDARQRINAELEKNGEKVSINDLLIKACAVALRRVPAVNASWAGDEILQHQVVDISVAVAIPEGLVTPVVRDADRKGVLEISREMRDLAARAREKKLKPEEMTGGTFSISNLGMYGIEEFAAVIQPPEAAILAVGAIREEPVVKNGSVVPGRRMRMTLSCDHRVIDGAVGAQWLDALRRLLEAPITMLM
jgi:pyruvate dehydrogenase E2 component (dihydrolipoamide acetyltransferase)